MGPIESGRLAGYYLWWVAITEIQTGDLVYTETSAVVYEVTNKVEPGDGSLIFFADVDAEKSAPGTIDQDTQLVFRNMETRFYVLKQTAPDENHIRLVPA